MMSSFKLQARQEFEKNALGFGIASFRVNLVPILRVAHSLSLTRTLDVPDFRAL